MANYVLNFTRGGTTDKKAMPAQARKLLEAGLWGVPPAAQLRTRLAPGDRVLAFVGAPDRVFVGDARVQTAYHPWTPDEAARYPPTTSFDHGITLSDVRVWTKPLHIHSVWGQTQGAKTNPKALWYGAIVSVSTADADRIVAAGTSSGASPTSTPAPTSGVPSPLSPAAPAASAAPSTMASGIADSAELFAVAQRLKKFLANPKPVNEDGTRAFFIDRMLDALGYSDFDDIEHGSAQSSGTFPDYILRSGGKRVIAVEAKRLGAALGEKEAAQLVSYCSVVAVRWGVLTDGRHIHVYDAPVVGVQPIERLVLQMDLADFADRDDFDARLWPAASMLSKAAMTTGNDLERHAARELIRTILADTSSASVKAIQQDLQSRKVIVTVAETAALVGELIG